MAQARARSNGGRDVKEDFEALCFALDTLRKDLDTLVADKDADSARARAGSDNGGDAKENFGTLRSDVDALLKDFGTFVSNLKNDASNRAEVELDAVRQRIATLAGDLQATGQAQVRNIEGQVEERPFVSLAVIFATGLMIGRLLHRR